MPGAQASFWMVEKCGKHTGHLEISTYDMYAWNILSYTPKTHHFFQIFCGDIPSCKSRWLKFQKDTKRHLGNEVCINHLPPIRNDSLAHRESCQSRSSLKSLVTKADGRRKARCDQPEQWIFTTIMTKYDWNILNIQQTLDNTLAKLFVRYLITIYNIWIQVTCCVLLLSFWSLAVASSSATKIHGNFYRKSNSLESWSNRKYREKRSRKNKLDGDGKLGDNSSINPRGGFISTQVGWKKTHCKDS